MNRLQRIGRRQTKRALKKTGGHKANAAKLLGINERTLRNKLKAEEVPVWVSSSGASSLSLEEEKDEPEERA